MDFFYIPPKLQREKVKAARRRAAPRFKSNIPPEEFSKRPPKSKSWRGAEKVWVHLGDECPRIGSGVRLVWAKRGTVWVRLCDPTGNRGKLRLDAFESAVR